MAEGNCREFSDRLPVVILRLARVFGSGRAMRWDELPHKFSALAAQGRNLTIHGAGDEVMDLLHVRDGCEAVARSCRVPIPNGRSVILNVGGANPTSVIQLAQLCVETARRRGILPVPFAFTDAPRGCSRAFGLDIDRARTLLRWTPQVPMDRAIDELVDAVKSR